MPKNTTERPRPHGRGKKGLLQRLQAGLYKLPAHVTSEDDWQKDAPNVKLSRAFAVVLGIHVVAIGGFMAYEMFRHKDPQAPTAQTAPAPREARPAAPVVTTAPRPMEPVLDDPTNDGLLRHTVQAGETLQAIAQKYDTTTDLLVEKNRIGADRPFQSGLRLVIPPRTAVTEVAVGPNRVAAPVGPAPAEIPDNPLAMTEVTPPFAPAPSTQKPASTAQATTKRPDRTPAPPATIASSKKTTPAPVKKAEPVAKKAEPPKTAKTATKGRTHVVAKGETAYGIAGKYGVSVNNLVRVNGIKPEKLKPGTKLVIPTGGTR